MKRFRSGLRSSIPAALALVLVLAACSAPAPAPTTNPSAQGDDELQSLVEAAQAEGRLVWYTATLEPQALRVAEAFKAQYGIDVELSRLSSADIIARYQAEADSGNTVADVIVPSYTGFVADGVAAGTLTALADADVPGYPGDYPADYLLTDEGTAIIMSWPVGIGYNSDLVDPKDVPKTWKDLADARWKNELLLVEPSTAEWYQALFDLLLDKYGDEYLEKIGENTRRFSRSLIPNVEAMGAGEGAISMPALGPTIADAKAAGAPVDFVQLDFSTGYEFIIGISADSPSPNAARLFAHFLLFGEGQEIFDSYEGIFAPGVSTKIPEEYTHPLEGYWDDDRRQKVEQLLGVTG